MTSKQGRQKEKQTERKKGEKQTRTERREQRQKERKQSRKKESREEGGETERERETERDKDRKMERWEGEGTPFHNHCHCSLFPTSPSRPRTPNLPSHPQPPVCPRSLSLSFASRSQSTQCCKSGRCRTITGRVIVGRAQLGSVPFPPLLYPDKPLQLYNFRNNFVPSDLSGTIAGGFWFVLFLNMVA